MGGGKVLNPEAAEFFLRKETHVSLPYHLYVPPVPDYNPLLSTPSFCFYTTTTHSAYYHSFSVSAYSAHSPIEPISLYSPQVQDHLYHSPATTIKPALPPEEPTEAEAKDDAKDVFATRVRNPLTACANRCLLAAGRKVGAGDEARGRRRRIIRLKRDRQRHAWTGSKVDDGGDGDDQLCHGGRNAGITYKSNKYYYNPQNVKSNWFVAKNKYSEVLPVVREEDITTVMIRNIPSKYTRKMLLDFLDHHCLMVNGNVAVEEAYGGEDHHQNQLSAAFDFLYLPVDFKSGLNKGYAFVNFTEPQAAWRFYDATNNQTWEHFKSTKIREIARARIQGKEELVRHFENVAFPCETEEVLPVCFSPARDGSGKLVKQSTVGRFFGNRRSNVEEEDKTKGYKD